MVQPLLRSTEPLVDADQLVSVLDRVVLADPDSVFAAQFQNNAFYILWLLMLIAKAVIDICLLTPLWMQLPPSIRTHCWPAAPSLPTLLRPLVSQHQCRLVRQMSEGWAEGGQQCEVHPEIP